MYQYTHRAWSMIPNHCIQSKLVPTAISMTKQAEPLYLYQVHLLDAVFNGHKHGVQEQAEQQYKIDCLTFKVFEVNNNDKLQVLNGDMVLTMTNTCFTLLSNWAGASLLL